MPNPFTDWLEGGDDAWDDHDDGDDEPRGSPRLDDGARSDRFAPQPRARAGRGLLLGLALVPWAVVAVVAAAWILSPGDGSVGPPVPQPAGSTPAAALSAPPGAPPPGEGPAADGANLGGVDPRPAASSAAALPAAASPADEDLLRAAAVLAVRAALSGPLPHGDASGAEERYVDLAAAESLHRAGNAAVVTVVAVIVEGADGRWDTARAARFAIPLSVGPGGPTPLGAPWALPSPELAVQTPGWEPIDDDAMADGAADALRSAGYQTTAIDAIARAPGLDDVVFVQAVAVAPGESAARPHDGWLRESPQLH
ncbi:MAG TPA: hypothetical protein VML96_05430, partial [Egibacteraceae bacterium]|nr:hypothetical protein [Egibacteraceae bacterium]